MFFAVAVFPHMADIDIGVDFVDQESDTESDGSAMK